MISSSKLENLPDIDGFIRLTQSLATLDAIMSPDWEYRYYSFDSKWSENDQMASMRNGSGDHWYSVITEHGVALLGLDHESPEFTAGTPKPWVFEALPEEFDIALRKEPAFDSKNSTYCVWRFNGSTSWQSGPKNNKTTSLDGSEKYLAILAGVPEDYVTFASEYYEHEPPIELVKQIYAHTPVTQELVSLMNPEEVNESLKNDLEQIGYPSKL